MDQSKLLAAGWTAEQIAQGRQWVEAWRRAGPFLEELRRQELRALDATQAIGWLCGTANYQVAPRAPRPTSGLVEQQRWFRRAAGRD